MKKPEFIKSMKTIDWIGCSVAFGLICFGCMIGNEVETDKVLIEELTAGTTKLPESCPEVWLSLPVPGITCGPLQVSLLGFDREPERPVFILEPQTSVGTGSWTYLGRVCYEFPDTIRSEFRLEIYQKTADIGTWFDPMIIKAGRTA